MITGAILAEMDSAALNTASIRRLLRLLAERTSPPWRHQFYTTNWDYLLQREIQHLNLTAQPTWFANTHVYHLNGTVEILANNAHRSNIVLETDFGTARTSTIETLAACNKMAWNQHFVVVGMSFECEVDKFLLSSLARVEDDLPIGESTWIIVNPSESTIHVIAQRIQSALPRAKVVPVVAYFGAWVEGDLKELQAIGAIDA